MRGERSAPYDATVYEAIARELSEGPVLAYADDRISLAVLRAVAAGHCSNSQVAARLNKHRVPKERGKIGAWDWAEVILAKERGTALEAAAYLKAHPRKLPTREEIEQLHADADAADASGAGELTRPPLYAHDPASDGPITWRYRFPRRT